MTATQKPQPQPTIKGAPRRYPIPLQLHYKATSKHGMVLGFGRATMISSQEIVFAAGGGLEPGMEAQIGLAWPVLLDSRIPLQLVLDTTITASHDGVAEEVGASHTDSLLQMRQGVTAFCSKDNLDCPEIMKLMGR